VMAGIMAFRALARANSGRRRAVSREEFAARIPGIYWNLAKDWDVVTCDLIGEKLGGLSGRTVQTYVGRYTDDGNPWPPPFPEN
jgi:hypothetical protein